jgi:hypothetical protein
VSGYGITDVYTKTAGDARYAYVGGSNASGTWGINITGSAGSVTNGVLTTGSYADPTWITSLAGSKITGNISGNAGTATTLATARALWGQSFDGSAAVTGALSGVTTIAASGTATISSTTALAFSYAGNADLQLSNASGVFRIVNAAYTVAAMTVTQAGVVSAGSSFSGPLTGTVTGSLIGNADTATKLATARAINGVNFDGSAAITVTAAAGTLSGATLASGVTASSLTSVGTLASLTVTGTVTAGGLVSTSDWTFQGAAGKTIYALNVAGTDYTTLTVNSGTFYIFAGTAAQGNAQRFSQTYNQATFTTPLAITGAFTGATTGAFSGTVTATRALLTATNSAYSGSAIAMNGSASGTTYLTNVAGTFYLSNNGSTDHLTIGSAGAATFSSSLAIGGALTGVTTYSGTGTLSIAKTTAGIGIYAVNSATAGSNYGVDGEATGAGATLNVGAYFAATGASTNIALQIPVTYPGVGVNNYAIKSDSVAQSTFAGPVSTQALTATGASVFNPTVVNTGISIYNSTATSDGASTPLWIAGKNAAASIYNVSIELATNAGAAGDMVFRTGANSATGFGTVALRLSGATQAATFASSLAIGGALTGATTGAFSSTLDVTGAVTFGNNVTQSRGLTGFNVFAVRNTTAGTGNGSVINMGTDTGTQAGALWAFSSTYTTTAGYAANGITLSAAYAGGLSLIAENASGTVRIYAANTLAATFTGANTALAGTLAVTGALTVTGVVNIPGTSYFKGNTAAGFRFNNYADTLNLLIITDAGAVSIPNGNLTVTGTVIASTGFTVGTSGAHKVVTNANATLGYLIRSGTWKGTAENTLALAAETGFGISMFTGGTATERFVIDSSGNVGIGTASPRTVTDIRTGADGVLSIGNTTETSGKYTGIRFGNYSATDGFYNAGILYKSTGDGASRGDLIIAMNTASNGVNATAANAVVTFAGATGIPTFSTTVKASDFVLT